MIDPATAAALLSRCKQAGAFATAYQAKADAVARLRRVIDDAETHRQPMQAQGPYRNALEAVRAADRRLVALTPSNANELAFKLAALLLDFEHGEPEYADNPVFWGRVRAEIMAMK